MKAVRYGGLFEPHAIPRLSDEHWFTWTREVWCPWVMYILRILSPDIFDTRILFA